MSINKKILVIFIIIVASILLIGVGTKLDMHQEELKKEIHKVSKEENIINHADEYIPIISDKLPKLILGLNEWGVESNGEWVRSIEKEAVKCPYSIHEIYISASTIVDGPIPDTDMIVYINNTWYIHKKPIATNQIKKDRLIKHIASCIDAYNNSKEHF